MKPTIIQRFKQQATQFPEKNAYVLLTEGDTKHSISFANLDQQAEAMAARIQTRLPLGAPIVLCLPPGIEFKVSWWACLYAGMVIIPLPPPELTADPKTFTVGPIFEDTQAKVILTTDSLKAYLKQALSDLPYFDSLTILSKEDLPTVPANHWQLPASNEDTVMFGSYTSGTTGQPKGVIITQGNLLTSVQDISTNLGLNQDQTLCTLFNHYHIIMALWEMAINLNGGQSVYLPIALVLKKPILLLKTLSDYQVNILMGVNLTLDLCVNRIQDHELSGINLSHLRLLVGGDKVKTSLLEQFVARYRNYGFRQNAVQSRYGQAEGFGFTSSILDEFPRIESISEEALADNLILPPQNDHDRIDLVTSGIPLSSVTLRIVDPITLEPRGVKQVGEVWIKGDAVGKGYWNRPEKTAETFNFYLSTNHEGPFLRTGDIGYLNGRGELFLVGRLKERLTINGRYYYPEPIENTTKSAHPLLEAKAYAFAAFTISPQYRDELVVAVELEDLPSDDLVEQLKLAVSEKIRQVHHIELYQLLVLGKNALPRTKTGKIKRNQCANLLVPTTGGKNP